MEVLLCQYLFDSKGDWRSIILFVFLLWPDPDTNNLLKPMPSERPIHFQHKQGRNFKLTTSCQNKWVRKWVSEWVSEWGREGGREGASEPASQPASQSVSQSVVYWSSWLKHKYPKAWYWPILLEKILIKIFFVNDVPENVSTHNVKLFADCTTASVTATTGHPSCLPSSLQ